MKLDFRSLVTPHKGGSADFWVTCLDDFWYPKVGQNIKQKCTPRGGGSKGSRNFWVLPPPWRAVLGPVRGTIWGGPPKDI